MKNTDIEALNGKQFITLDSCLDAIDFILEAAGSKEKETTDYMSFINLKKGILLGSGRYLYAIWISNFYGDNDKKVFQIRLQIDHAFTYNIAVWIEKAVNDGELILCDEVKQELNKLKAA